MNAPPHRVQTVRTASRRSNGAIVCGTDFSASAAEAGRAAAALASRLGVPLFLVHSIAETCRGAPPGPPNAVIPKLQERIRAEAERLRESGAIVTEQVLHGIPEDGINQFAQRAKAPLIVFGCPELGVLDRWLAGSVAEVIAESASVPTLLVRTAAPVEKWTRGEQALRILIAADLTSGSDSIFQWAGELSEIGLCEFTVAYVDRGAAEDHKMVTVDAMRTTAESPDARSAKLDLLERATRCLGMEPGIRVIPASAPVEIHLHHLAREIGADLLIAGTHQRHGFERLWHHSVSRALLRHAPVNLACVPVIAPAIAAG